MGYRRGQRRLRCGQPGVQSGDGSVEGAEATLERGDVGFGGLEVVVGRDGHQSRGCGAGVLQGRTVDDDAVAVLVEREADLCGTDLLPCVVDPQIFVIDVTARTRVGGQVDGRGALSRGEREVLQAVREGHERNAEKRRLHLGSQIRVEDLGRQKDEQAVREHGPKRQDRPRAESRVDEDFRRIDRKTPAHGHGERQKMVGDRVHLDLRKASPAFLEGFRGLLHPF